MGESEGVPTRYLLGLFFVIVLVCAVFFSLGYFLGYREGRPSGVPVTQQVAASSSDAPAPVNSPPGAASPEQPASTGQTASSVDTQSPATETVNPDQNAAPAPSTLPQSASSSPPADATQPAAETPDGTPAATETPAAAPDSALTPRRVPPGLLIQVGAVRGRQDASRVAETLRSKGFPALVLTPEQVGASDSFFRVVAGPYRSHAAAEAALKKLTREGYKPFIRQ